MVRNLLRQNKDLEAEIKSCRSGMSGLNKEISELKVEISKLKVERSELKAAKKVLESENERLKSTFSNRLTTLLQRYSNANDIFAHFLCLCFLIYMVSLCPARIDGGRNEPHHVSFQTRKRILSRLQFLCFRSL